MLRPYEGRRVAGVPATVPERSGHTPWLKLFTVKVVHAAPKGAAPLTKKSGAYTLRSTGLKTGHYNSGPPEGGRYDRLEETAAAAAGGGRFAPGLERLAPNSLHCMRQALTRSLANSVLIERIRVRQTKTNL